jgi:signal transduction histidine kinase
MASILVVDDEESVRLFLVQLLSARGYQLLDAANGAEGLKMVESHHPDLVITDVTMPIMDGYEFVRQMRSRPAIAATPVIFHTAFYQQREAYELAQACGVNHLLCKPTELKVICSTVEAALSGKRPAAPPAPSEEFDREHLRLLTDRLAHEVDELQKVNARLKHEAEERARAERSLDENRRRLQALSRQLLSAQETERRHIARELHDQIGQALTAVKINLQAMKRSSEAVPALSRLDDSIATIEWTLDQVRNLSLDLRPSMLDDLGLGAALRWYLDRQARQSGFVAQLVIDPDLGALAPELETTCFRVVQEGLTNVARHAQARQVRVEVHQRQGELHLLLRDNGVGFDVAAARARATRGASLGLLGMHERVTLLGGHLDIDSQFGQGTEIRVRLPLSAAAPAADWALGEGEITDGARARDPG